MQFSQAVLALAALKTIHGAPVAPRQQASVNDTDILNYALTLEHLENTFYAQNLAQFDEAAFKAAGCNDTLYQNLKEISKDESEHVKFLTAALTAEGVTPVQACTYNFGVTDVNSFLATASILEGVGVSAYLGAAASIMEKAYLTAAGSILTVEARHSSFVRSVVREAPFPAPYDTPISFNEAFSLASLFITACPPENPALPFKAFPTLVVSGDDKIVAGSTVDIATPNLAIETADGAKVFAAFISATGPVFVEATAGTDGYTAVVPAGLAGQTYVVLTSSNETVTDDTTIAGPAIIEVPLEQ